MNKRDNLLYLPLIRLGVIDISHPLGRILQQIVFFVHLRALSYGVASLL